LSANARARVLVLLALAAAGVLVAWGISHFDISLADPDALAEDVRATGVLAPLLLVALLVLQSVVAPLPSQPVLMAAGFVYGPWLGLAIGWLGVLVGAVACFGIARLLGRPAVVHFVRPERLAAVDDYVSAHGLRKTFVAILSLRLLAHFSFDVTSYACGLVRFPFGWFALATALGEIPKVLIFTALGAGLGEIPGWVGVAVAASVIATIGAFLLIRRSGATRSAAAPASQTSRSTS
jgi:uncharacterized membrane protein YdjX (TVP38/TMEM64 family)